MTHFQIEYSDGVNWKILKHMYAKSRPIKLKRKWYNPFSWGELTIFEPEARFMRRVFRECRTLWESNKYRHLRAIDVWVHQQGESVCKPYQNGRVTIFEHLSERYWRYRDNPFGGLLVLIGIIATIVCIVRWW